MFSEESTSVELLNVIFYEDFNADVRHRGGQEYCALSFRLAAEETEILIDGEIHPIHPGEVVFFPCRVPYRRRTRHDRLMTFHFLAPGLERLPFRVFDRAVSEPLASVFREAQTVWSARGQGYRWRAQALLCDALSRLFFETGNAGPSPLVSQAITFLRAHYGDPAFSIASLSDLTHVSSAYLRRLFLRETGMPPKQYLTEIRFSHAKALLNTGLLPVAAVAEACGFSDPKNFTTAFRRRFGYPPSSQTYARR